jgi:hypothetical protein
MKALMVSQRIQLCGWTRVGVRSGLLVLAGVVLCASTALAQSSFADAIEGSAEVCQAQEFDVQGSAQDGYDLKDEASESCDLGTAGATTMADIGPPTVSVYATTTLIKVPAEAATSASSSLDTAILMPPKGFKGSSVSGVFYSSYQFQVANVSGYAVGEYQICWSLDEKLQSPCATASNNVKGKKTFSRKFKVVQSAAGFQLPVVIGASSDAVNGATAQALVSDSHVEGLPKGWIWQWASKQKGGSRR